VKVRFSARINPYSSAEVSEAVNAGSGAVWCKRTLWECG